MVSALGKAGQALRNDFALPELFDPFRVEQSLHGSFRGLAPTAIHVHPLRGCTRLAEGSAAALAAPVGALADRNAAFMRQRATVSKIPVVRPL